LIDSPGMRFIPMFAVSFTTLKGLVPFLAKLISISAFNGSPGMRLFTAILYLAGALIVVVMLRKNKEQPV
jgi:hypothetical protein